jgi:hypothetical protein
MRERTPVQIVAVERVARGCERGGALPEPGTLHAASRGDADLEVEEGPGRVDANLVERPAGILLQDLVNEGRRKAYGLVGVDSLLRYDFYQCGS